MDNDDVAKTLVHIGERLESTGRKVTCEAYVASELLRELDVELVPTLPGSNLSGSTTENEDAGDLSTVEVVSQALESQRGAAAMPAYMGRFQIQCELGRGGMGRVYEAHDSELRRQVAVKCFVDPSQISNEHLTRFVAEAQITAQLEHPNIVPVYDMGVTLEGQLYYVMRRIVGRSLRDVLRHIAGGDSDLSREWSRHRLLGAFCQVCQAVAYAHDRGVVHRDLKPANIMLGSFGEVLVVDWGIAKIIEIRRAAPVNRITFNGTEWGQPVGTPGYMSPEQILGQQQKIDARSDVWSLGAILYEILTLQKCFQGNETEINEKVLTNTYLDPREYSLDRPVPDELAEVSIKAMESDPIDRFQNAAELAYAIESHLEGSRRASAAEDYALQALALFREYESLGQEKEYLRKREIQIRGKIAPWAPLSKKEDLLTTQNRIEELESQRAETFARVVHLAERALEKDPTNPEARSLLAQAYATRLIAAEKHKEKGSQKLFESRVRAYDDGALTELLDGTGALVLRTDPPGAEVLCQRFEQRGLVWTLGAPVFLGRTPLEGDPLPMGSYLLTIRSPGCRDTLYPVFIERCQLWNSGELPIPLFSDELIGNGYVYVPRGQFICGGDAQAPGSQRREESWTPGFFIAQYPVTMEEYCEFINELHAENPEEAWSRVPRIAASPRSGSGQYWKRPASSADRYVIPTVDADGDEWNTQWPAAAVSWRDATRYVEWRSGKDGYQYLLPPELWWEKAARGVDGRYFPWGDGFDPSLCLMRFSNPGRPLPRPVGISHWDVSVYGVHDVAGSSSEWCGDRSFDNIPELRPVRGGSWKDYAGHCRLAYRQDFEAWKVKNQVGFRLCRAAL